MLEAQQGQIKLLTDTLAQLSTKIEMLERNSAQISQAQASVPKELPKKPMQKPAPAISTGGAPLPASQGGKR